MKKVRRSSAAVVAWLVVTGLLVGALIRPVSTRMGLSAPRPGWFAACLLVVVAVAVAGAAWFVWQSLHQRKERMTYQFATTLLALAKACVVVGAVYLGGYGGLALSFAENWDTELGRERVLQGGVTAVASGLLLVAALLLERALQLPQGDDEDDVPSGGAPSAA